FRTPTKTLDHAGDDRVPLHRRSDDSATDLIAPRIRRPLDHTPRQVAPLKRHQVLAGLLGDGLTSDGSHRFPLHAAGEVQPPPPDDVGDQVFENTAPAMIRSPTPRGLEYCPSRNSNAHVPLYQVQD